MEILIRRVTLRSRAQFYIVVPVVNGYQIITSCKMATMPDVGFFPVRFLGKLLAINGVSPLILGPRVRENVPGDTWI